MAPAAPKPMIIIAQVAGSGTATPARLSNSNELPVETNSILVIAWPSKS